MRSVHVQGDLADNFEPSGLPPTGPDGAVQLSPTRELPVDPPRLCEAGPCRRYHRFQIRLDAQDPMNERKPDGTVVHHGRVFHVQTHHYCYPDVGIELELGALPVLTCNKWVPATSLVRFRTKRSIKRAFERELETWRDGQLAEWQGTGLAPRASEPAEAPKKRNLRVGIRFPAGGIRDFDAPAPLGWSLRTVVDGCLAMTSQDWPLEVVSVAIVASLDPADLPPFNQTAYVEPLDNLDATIEQLGLADGERLLVTTKRKEIP